MRLAIFFAAVLLAAPCFADSITVTFDTVAVDGELQVLPGGVFQGMRFVEHPTVGALHLIDDGGCFVGCAASDSISLLYEGMHHSGQPPLIIEHPAGLAFRLLNLDVAEAVPVGGPRSNANAQFIGLIGTLNAGGTIEAFIELDGIADGPGGAADFQAIAIESTLFDQPMSSIAVWGLNQSGTVRPDPTDDFTNAGFSLDNLSFDVLGAHADYTALNVPEPAAAMLAGFALCCLFQHRKRLTASKMYSHG